MMTALLRCSCTGPFPYHRILLVPRHCPRFPRYLHHHPHQHFHWLYMPPKRKKPKRKQPKRRTQSQTTFSSLFLPLIFRLFAPEVVSPVHPATSSPLGGSPIALYERDIIYHTPPWQKDSVL